MNSNDIEENGGKESGRGARAEISARQALGQSRRAVLIEDRGNMGPGREVLDSMFNIRGVL